MSEPATIKIPSLVEGMSFRTYLADPAPSPSLTSSLVRELLQTAPRRAWQNCSRLNPDYEAEEKGTFDLGTAAHALFVGGGDEIAVVNEKDWRTKAAKEAKAAAYAAGKTPIKIADMHRVEAMAIAATKQFNRSGVVSPLVASSLREASIFWNEAGVLCRCRPDFYSTESAPPPVIVHYKTTGITINPFSLSKYAASLGWEMIAAHYAAGVKALTGEEPRQFFAVQENTPPYLCLVAEMDQRFLQLGQIRRDRALDIWAWCLRKNEWPTWPARTVVMAAPPWHETEAEAKCETEQAAIDDDGGDLLLQADDWKI